MALTLTHSEHASKSRASKARVEQRCKSRDCTQIGKDSAGEEVGGEACRYVKERSSAKIANPGGCG